MNNTQLLIRLNEKLEAIQFRSIDDDKAASQFWELAQVIKMVEKGLYTPAEVELVLTRYRLSDTV